MDAVRQTGALARAPERKLGDDAPPPSPGGWLVPEYEDAIVRATGISAHELAALHRWVNGFEEFIYTKRLDIRAWPDIQDWAEKLTGEWAQRLTESAADQAGDEALVRETIIGELGAFDQLRYVLNAAWLARIAVDDGEEDVDDPTDLREIADVTEALLWSLLERAGQQKTAGDGPQPRRQARQRPSPTSTVQSSASLARGQESR
jgi:hypothetical protein